MLAGSTKTAFSLDTSAITPTPTLTSSLDLPLSAWPTPVSAPILSRDVLHFLLIGADGGPYIKDQHTDTIIVAVLNKNTRQVSLLSIPRDLWVYIPTYGYARINEAHRIGHRRGYPGKGPGLLIDTLKHNLGISIDHWLRIDLQGFARIVDELGGLEMTVVCPVNLRYLPPRSAEEKEMWLMSGVYRMDGATALRYVRTRRGDSDFQRAGRQHQFLKALWSQSKYAGLILKLPALWSALSGSFYTDLTLGDVLALAPMALELRPENIRSHYIGPGQLVGWTTAGGARVQLPQQEKIQQLVASLYAPPPKRVVQVAAEQARILVLNGTQRPQLDRIAANQLRWHGFNVVDAGPAENQHVKHTKIIAFRDRPHALDSLAGLLKVKPKNITVGTDREKRASDLEADLLLIVGEDYDPCR
jgi:LCP family protein required for cell wall assembly